MKGDALSPNDELLAALEEASALLHGVHETFWASKIDSLLKSCSRSLTGVAAQRILQWYGGMGSFNDLTISRINDHEVGEHEEAEINDRLAVLREEIYAGARRLARERH